MGDYFCVKHEVWVLCAKVLISYPYWHDLVSSISTDPFLVPCFSRLACSASMLDDGRRDFVNSVMPSSVGIASFTPDKAS